jgi:sugar phosphate permease
LTLATRLARRRIHYGWIVAAVTFLVLLSSAGVRATPSILMVPLEREFGWTRATISLAISINLVLYGLMGPFAAALMQRLGVRRTVLASVVTLVVGISLTPLMRAPWQLVLLWGVVVGAGTGMTALVLGATVVNRWFTERRGLVMGILTASTATGQLVFLPLLAMVVERYGWRAATLVVAGAAALIIPLVLGLMRERPEELGLARYGENAAGQVETRSSPSSTPAGALAGLRRGIRSRDFWLLAGSFFICGASTNGLIGTHLIPACIDHGISEVRAAGLLAAMGIFDFIGTTGSGWLSDRWNNRYLLSWYYGRRGLSLLFRPYALVNTSVGLPVFAVFYGLDWIATVPPTVRLTTNVFGRESAAIMFGWVVAAHQLGAATAALGAGALRTALGGYVEAFTISGALCFVAAVMVLGINRKASPGVGLTPEQVGAAAFS